MKKIIPILLPGLFSAAEILAALYLKRQIPAGSAGLSMAADLLLYAWIAYNGCSWTIGYKKIFIHGDGQPPMIQLDVPYYGLFVLLVYHCHDRDCQITLGISPTS